MNRNQRKKSYFQKIEVFFKKYQTSFSILMPTILSIYALILSLNANNLAKRQIAKEKIPNWDYKIITTQEFNFRQVQFISLRQDIKIQSVEIFTPFNKNENETFISETDILNLYPIEEKIFQYDSSFYKYNIVQTFMLPESIKIFDTYPVIIKFNYTQNNTPLTDYILYKINYKIYNNTSFRITSFTLIEPVNEMDKKIFGKYLDYINKTECMEKSAFAFSDELIKDVKLHDSTNFNFFLWTDEAYEEITKSVFLSDSNSTSDILEISIPNIYKDSATYSGLIKNRDLILKDKLQNSAVKIFSNRIDSFFKENPFPLTNKVELQKNSKWACDCASNSLRTLLINEYIRIWQIYNPKMNIEKDYLK